MLATEGSRSRAVSRDFGVKSAIAPPTAGGGGWTPKRCATTHRTPNLETPNFGFEISARPHATDSHPLTSPVNTTHQQLTSIPHFYLEFPETFRPTVVRA
jgi:hypothetical protein